MSETNPAQLLKSCLVWYQGNDYKVQKEKELDNKINEGQTYASSVWTFAEQKHKQWENGKSIQQAQEALKAWEIAEQAYVLLKDPCTSLKYFEYVEKIQLYINHACLQKKKISTEYATMHKPPEHTIPIWRKKTYYRSK